MKKFKLLLASFSVLLSTSVIADAGIDQFKKELAKKLPSVEITNVSKSPLEGLYQVVSGSQVVYMTKDARYMIDGDFVDLSNKRNYTEEAKSGIRLSKIDALGEENMLIYTPEKVKHTVTVVTDIDCPYCRRLHDEMSEYMDLGVRVRYIFMPLKGKEDFNTTVSVWCSEDRNLSLDIAKSGGSIESKTCDNPITDHLTLSRNLGVRGTPAIIMEDGSLLPGYVPIKKLIRELRKI